MHTSDAARERAQKVSEEQVCRERDRHRDRDKERQRDRGAGWGAGGERM